MIITFARALTVLAFVVGLSLPVKAQVPYHGFPEHPLPPLPWSSGMVGPQGQLIHFGLPWGGAGFGINPQRTFNLLSPLPHPWWGLPGSGISMHHPPHFDVMYGTNWLGMQGAIPGGWEMTNPYAFAAPPAAAGYPGMMPYVVVPYPVPVVTGGMAQTASTAQPVLCGINQVTLLARTVDDCETAGGDVQPAPGSAAVSGADDAPSDSGTAGSDQSN